MILFTYLCSKICLLLNTPAPVGTTLRCRRNSRRFKNSQIELCMVDKGFGGRQYQKTTLASNPKRDYIHTCLFTIHHVLLLLVHCIQYPIDLRWLHTVAYVNNPCADCSKWEQNLQRPSWKRCVFFKLFNVKL